MKELQMQNDSNINEDLIGEFLSEISENEQNHEGNESHIVDLSVDEIPENKIMFTTTDPLGNNVTLWTNTWNFHIAGENGHHPDRAFLNTESNIDKIKKIICSPTLITTDSTHDHKNNYFDVVAFEGARNLKNVKIVTEQVGIQTYSIATVIPLGQIKSEAFEGRVIYDRHSE